MSDVFHQLYYHVVWTTKNREPMIGPHVREHLRHAIREKCRRLGCIVHAVNAVADHVHLALEIPPRLAVSNVVGQIKGASAHEMNQLRPRLLAWQEGYGVLTFRRSELTTVVRYIATQEARHEGGGLSPLFEACETLEQEP
jgi:REP element-mobilizing transposase RayT